MLKDKENSGQEREEVQQSKGGKDVQGQTETEKGKGKKGNTERQREGENEGEIIIKLLDKNIFILTDAPTIVRN